MGNDWIRLHRGIKHMWWLLGFSLLLLLPMGAWAQGVTNPQRVTEEAIDRLRFGQGVAPDAAGEIEVIIERLERSRRGTDGNELIVDNCHLAPAPRGLTAWIETRQAVLQLQQLLDQANRKNPRIPLSLAVQGLLADVRDRLVNAYRFLADVAVQEAQAFADDPSGATQASLAARRFADAEAEIAAGDVVRGMQSLRQAWEHAQLAFGEASSDNSPLLNIQNPVDGATVFASPVDVAGMVQLLTTGTVGADDVTVTVNGQPAEVVQRSFLARSIPLRDGLNALVGVARSPEGGVGTACVAVQLDPTVRPRIAAVGGTAQQATISTTLPESLAVQVTDDLGNPAGGEQVIFRVSQGDGTLTGGVRATVVETDGEGLASTDFTLGSRAGVAVNRVRATAVGLEGEVIFSPTALTAGADRIHAVSGDNQRGLVGEPLASPLVAVVTDSGQNLVSGVPVTFEVVDGDGLVNGEPQTVVATDSDGRAAVTFTLGSEPGLDIHLVRASFPGLTREPLTFKASGFIAGDPSDTHISGVVLDGQGDPVPGVTLTVEGTETEVRADEDGQFVLTGVPVGEVALEMDATTASRPGVWSSLGFHLHTLPGVDNRLPKPIFTLPLDVDRGKVVGGPEDVTLEIPEVPGFSLTVLAGSATFLDGSPTGVVSVTPVHADKIPMAPGSGMQPRFIVTVQPAGVHFDPPAPVTYPNVDGLPPGAVTEMFSFDHDLGEFVSIGTGTVSEDGTVVRSDPGFGIVKAGWHCAAPQSESGAGASLQVTISTADPVTVCRDQNDQPVPISIEASGGPPRDASYSWKSSDSSVASLDPSGGGLCEDQTQCNTEASAGTQAGKATATVTITCKTNGATDDDEIEVINPGVEVVGVNICNNEVDTQLRPIDPNLQCRLRLSMIADDGSRHEFLSEDRTGGDYIDPIDFDALPTGIEFVEVEAEWRCDPCAVGARDRQAAHFLSLGRLRHTAYNCPSSGDATCSGGGDVDVCFTDAGCNYNGPDQVPQQWLTQVTGTTQGTGCGSVPGHGDVQIEEFCLQPTQINNFPPPANCMGLPTFREGGAITGSCGAGVNANTVAVDDAYLNGDLPCGTNVCILAGGGAGITKTVTDRCPGCGLGRIDNFSTSGECGIGDFAPDAVTLKLF